MASVTPSPAIGQPQDILIAPNTGRLVVADSANGNGNGRLVRVDPATGAMTSIVTGFDMARVLALGADWCNAARGFMFALGCVQAQSCHTDRCPTGVATQNALRQRALVVPDKAERVRRFHDNTLAALAELIGAAGLRHPNDLTPLHMLKRVSSHEVKSFAELYTFLADKELLAGSGHPLYAQTWNIAHASRFTPLPEVKTAADAQGQAA